jgi:hypothetical protein
VNTPGRHTSGDGSLARSGGGAAVRGAVLIAVAVILGLVLLSKGIEDGNLISLGTDNGGSTSGTGDGATTTTATAGETTTTTLAPPRPPNEVKVLVLNGAAGKTGVAARATQQLQAVNYNVLSPDNAPDAPVSTVYFTPGYQSDAQAIAGALGITTPVAPMPAPPPVPDIRGANVVVVLGADTPPAA